MTRAPVPAPPPAPPGLIHVFCARPGLRRVGLEHPAYHAYGRGELTDEQIQEMAADPLLILLVGDRIMPGNLATQQGAE